MYNFSLVWTQIVRKKLLYDLLIITGVRVFLKIKNYNRVRILHLISLTDERNLYLHISYKLYVQEVLPQFI